LIVETGGTYFTIGLHRVKTSGKTPWMGDQTIARPLPSVQLFLLGDIAQLDSGLVSFVVEVF
jgi:hypothetical protein